MQNVVASSLTIAPRPASVLSSPLPHSGYGSYATANRGDRFLSALQPQRSEPQNPSGLNRCSSTRLASPLQDSASFGLFPARFAAGVDGQRQQVQVVAHDALDQLQITSVEAGMGGEEEGPVPLPSEIDPFEIPEASPIQLVGSVILTGAIAVLLYRSLRRRAQRAKELKLRSSSIESARAKLLKEAQGIPIEKIKAPEVKTQPPSFGQTFLGALIAGAFAFVLYKFTVTVEGGFADKPVSADYTIRNLTITIRTIINGLLYLATFVFAANSIGLTLYSFQLLFNTSSTTDVDKNVNIIPDKSMPDSQDGAGDKGDQS